MTVNELLNKGKMILIENNVEEASLICRMLLSNVLEIRKEDLIIISEKKVKSKKEKDFLNRNRKNKKWIPDSIYNSF